MRGWRDKRHGKGEVRRCEEKKRKEKLGRRSVLSLGFLCVWETGGGGGRGVPTERRVWRKQEKKKKKGKKTVEQIILNLF
jgi:N-methylhydantoinase B/oxoprolinase/acetone carboxylase alpha subunit